MKVNALNIVANSIHTKKLCSRLYSSELRFVDVKRPFWFLSTYWGGGLGATYDVYLRLIGKRVVDFLLTL